MLILTLWLLMKIQAFLLVENVGIQCYRHTWPMYAVASLVSCCGQDSCTPICSSNQQITIALQSAVKTIFRNASSAIPNNAKLNSVQKQGTSWRGCDQQLQHISDSKLTIKECYTGQLYAFELQQNLDSISVSRLLKFLSYAGNLIHLLICIILNAYLHYLHNRGLY